MNVKNIAKAYNKSKLFNEIAGNLYNVDKNSIACQLDYIQSEYFEAVKAYDDESPTELLDGAIDMFVTVVGLMQELESAGYNVEKALELVCENNLSKYVPNGDFLRYNEGLVATLNKKHNVWVIKDAFGKVKKHSFFKSVVLDDLVPKEFFKEAI